MEKKREDILQDLDIKAKEIRRKLIETVSKNGGHLSSNLGIVELTLCLHESFDIEKDKILLIKQ